MEIMIWITYAIMMLATVIQTVMAIRLRRRCKIVGRLIGYNQSMIATLQSMHSAGELQDIDCVSLFCRRYQQIAIEYEAFLNSEVI